MSDDETWVMVASGMAALLLLVNLYWRIIAGQDSGRAAPERIILAIAPLLAAAVVYIVLRHWASADVQNAPQYILLYMLLGVVWFLGATLALERFGISFRDDALGERNPAAALVVAATVIAHAAIYAGANIGNGPGWWTVVVAAGIGSAVWFALWYAVEAICGLSEDVTVDRDLPAAVRLSGYALGMGILAARGAAGDWTSLTQTVIEFVVAWPMVPLTLVVILFEKFLERQPQHTRRNLGLSVMLALLYVFVGIAGVGIAGPLPNNPHFDFLNWIAP